jgi:4-cresol dehydrogenase (hydroxylating)
MTSDDLSASENAPALLSALRDAVGPQWVISGEPGIDEYRDPYSVFEDDPFVPLAAVCPDSVEQVREILRVANRYRHPLWPISRGKNLAYGGAAPRLPGSIVLDLRRMNRILEVNEKFGYALVEPGVSYFDLYRHLAESGSGLWVDVPDLGWGSVLGNTVERGNGYTPYGDHFMTQCGMEVVLPDGDLLRTGMGALPGNNTWQLFKYGFGPYLDGLFTQSNFGVVTKIGVWLMPKPPGYRPYMISFPREDDIHQIVEIMRPLKINQVIQNTASIRSLLLEAAVTATKRQYFDGAGPTPADVQHQIMIDQDIGRWNLYGAQYGPPAVIGAYWSEIRDAFGSIEGAKFYFADDRPPGSVLEHRARTMAGIPALNDLKILDWVGNGGHINVSPISPASGEDALRQYRMVSALCHEYGQDYLGDLIIGAREMHHIVMLVFDTESEEQKRLNLELCRRLVADAAQAGYGEYRTHLSLMDQIAATYSFNDGALMRFNERIKDALDPNGIIAPGKQGIWPRHLRGQDHSI